MKKITLFTILMLLVLPVMAGTVSVDVTHKATPDADVTIELIAGKVTLIGTSGNEIRVRGTVNDRWETVKIHGDSSDVRIEVELPKGKHRNVELEADLEISVPAGVELTFETVSADLSLDGLTDAVTIESVSGEVVVRGDLTELTIESISGNVDIEAGRALDDLDVEIISGNVEMRGELNPSSDYSFSVVSGVIKLWVPEDASADYEIENL